MEHSDMEHSEKRAVRGTWASGTPASASTTIEVLLLSESRLCREALSLALEGSGGLHARAAESASEAAEILRRSAPTVLLLQLSLTVGVAVARMLAPIKPSVRVIVLDAGDSEHERLAWMDAGVAACLPMRGSIADLIQTIQDAPPDPPAGSAPSSRGAVPWARAPREHSRESERAEYYDLGLTRRQYEVFRLLERGLSNKEIAQSLWIETATVKNHVHSILGKLGARNRLEAIALVGARADVANASPVASRAPTLAAAVVHEPQAVAVR